LKVSVFAWWLFWNRLQSKVNLFRRENISHESHLCVGGCDLLETTNHLFLDCSFFCSIWQRVRNWLGVHSTDSSIIADNFLQFGGSSGYAKSRRSFMLLIWFASSWVIWKKRNYKIFHGKENSPLQLLKNIKYLSFWWFKAKFLWALTNVFSFLINFCYIIWLFSLVCLVLKK